MGVGKKLPNLVAAKDDEETRVTSDAHKAIFQAVKMARFANYLRQMWHTEVIDRTGIVGKFDLSIDMDAAREQAVQGSTRTHGQVSRTSFAVRLNNSDSECNPRKSP